MSIFSNYPGDPPDEGRDPIPEEIEIQDLLETTPIRMEGDTAYIAPDVIDKVMVIVGSLVNQINLDCPRCEEAAWLSEAAAEAAAKGEPPVSEGEMILADALLAERYRREELEFVAAALYLGHDDAKEQFDMYKAVYLSPQPQQPDPAESTDAFEITEDEIKAVPSGDPAQWETSMRELCQEIEKLPASEQQTAISVKASAIYQSLAEFNRYCNAQFEDMRQKHPDLFKKSAGSTDADKGVCECGHFDTNHASRYGECFKCADKCGKPTAPPEQGEVCETCEHPKCNHEFADVLDESDIGRCFNGCGCRQFKPATPPASEPSRDAVIAAARHWLEANTPIRWTTQEEADASDIEFDIPLSELPDDKGER